MTGKYNIVWGQKVVNALIAFDKGIRETVSISGALILKSKKGSYTKRVNMSMVKKQNDVILFTIQGTQYLSTHGFHNFTSFIFIGDDLTLSGEIKNKIKDNTLTTKNINVRIPIKFFTTMDKRLLSLHPNIYW